MPIFKRICFDLARKLLISVTGTGNDRSPRVNDLHHKLSYRLHKKLGWFGITGEVKLAVPGMLGYTLRMIAEDGGVAHQFLVYGRYEPFESSLVRELLKPGMTVYNVGANIGYYTLLASLSVGERGKVIAFEPSKTNYRLLQGNIEENRLRNVVAKNVAVSDSSEPIKLYLSGTNSGDHKIFANGAEVGRSFEEIPAVRLDDVVRNEGAPDVIIMDVQGAEARVLRGLSKYATTQGRKPLILFTEFAPANLRQAGSSAEEYLQLLKTANLDIRLINEQKRQLVSITAEELISTTKGFQEKNLLCLDSRKNPDF